MKKKNPDTLSHWPLTGGVEMAWPPTDPAAQGITPTLHAGLVCSVLSGIDTDLDGVDDAIDNCTLVGNADQRDTNGDGFGNICDADLNGDNLTDLTDFSQFRSAFGTTDPDADFDGSGSVNLSDFSIFRSLFGSAPGPSGLNP